MKKEIMKKEIMKKEIMKKEIMKKEIMNRRTSDIKQEENKTVEQEENKTVEQEENKTVEQEETLKKSTINKDSKIIEITENTPISKNKKNIFSLSYFGFSEKKAFDEVFKSEDSSILVKNGIIFARSHLSLIPYLKSLETLKMLVLLDKDNNKVNVRIEAGILLVLVQDTANIEKSECNLQNKEILELLDSNTHLMHNGMWWVQKYKPAGTIKDKEYKTIRKLNEERI